jgi:hypothetical protein
LFEIRIGLSDEQRFFFARKIAFVAVLLLSAGVANAEERTLFVPAIFAPEVAPCVQRRLELMIPRSQSIPPLKLPDDGESYIEVMVICDGKDPYLACAAQGRYVYGTKFVDQAIKPDLDPGLRKWMLLNLSQPLNFGVMFGSVNQNCERLSEMMASSILRHLAW